MSRTSNNKLLTCRYWALGPSCPNVDRGVEACQFAHWDTGTLAGSHLQRGTCALWQLNRCVHGKRCYYEHRHTGIPGLYQGVIALTGINLEIAEAASQSGFNTFNHEALMNLIWSIKRVILKNSNVHGGEPPPKHPIYPDRYRPGGKGDNTKRKRHIPTTGSPPPFFPVRPLEWNKTRNKGKRKKQNATNRNPNTKADPLRRVVGSARVSKSTMPQTVASLGRPFQYENGTRTNPIDLIDSDDERGNQSQAANVSAKRQITSSSNIGNYTVRTPKARALGDSIAVDSSSHNAPASDIGLVDVTEPNMVVEVTPILADVKVALEMVQRSMQDCRSTMRALFERQRVMLSKDEIFAIMTTLSSAITRAEDGARDGVIQVQNSVHWLKKG